MRLRFGRLMLLCAIAVGAGALPVVLLEIGLRILGYGYDGRFFVPLPGGPFHTANQRFGRRFFPPQLARTPAPERFLQPKPAGTYRIFILGESAAMGFPEPGFSFGRHLEMMLRRMYPARRFEAIQASMTAINSHAILPIARDCLAFQPDLFIAYVGNNEVVGPYGAGTVFTRQAGSLALVRASVWLSATRTGQMLAGLARRRDQPPDWRGMEMFLGQSVPFDDPRLQAVYANFRRNMTDLCRVMRRTGASAILSTVAVNLKDAPPFASETASARFSHAHTLLARGRTEEARREFALARDLDELRFRADSTINRIVRETASAERVPLVDAEQIFGRDGVPGDNFFYEHVHLKPSGNYLLARSLLAEVVTALRLEPAAPPDERTVASDLVRTSWDDYRSGASIAALLRRPSVRTPRE